MNENPVIELLREQIGIAPESLGPSILPRALAARLRALGLADPAEYAARVLADAQEFQQLVDLVTVPETWFFRGPDVFAYLAGRIAEETKKPARGRFRVLSVPCSTGEEPYSLAIALEEKGISPERWSIEGIDLCAKSIARAQAATFGELSFRQMPQAIKDRYFRPSAAGWQLDPALRSRVRFRQGNLLSPLLAIDPAPYDLIFCRNLLIYLNAPARQRALAVLHRLLAPEGLLCVGHAEPLEFSDDRFVPSGPPGFFLYRRRPLALPQVSIPRALPSAPARPRAVRAPATAPAPAIDFFEQARTLADRGQIDEALAVCRAGLTANGASPRLMSLLGTLHLARKDPEEAARCFQRALYLDPRDRDALTHLMLLCQEQGDHAQAARLRRRLERDAVEGHA